MQRLTHRIYVGVLAFIVITVSLFLAVVGSGYYALPVEERFFHAQHDLFKPSGLLGHGLGIVGSVLIVIGVASYILRKRLKVLSRVGLIKHWLEFHIFLCTLGPVMILFHTAFKFGGIVSISFWSMVAVVASGVLGRFIYLQIPRTLEGRELNLQEVKTLQDELKQQIEDLGYAEGELIWAPAGASISESPGLISAFMGDRQKISRIKKSLKTTGVSRKDQKRVVDLIKNERKLNRRIGRLLTMQKVFRYWHVAHMPFAIVMLTIMVIHVVVVMLFGNF